MVVTFTLGYYQNKIVGPISSVSTGCEVNIGKLGRILID